MSLKNSAFLTISLLLAAAVAPAQAQTPASDTKWCEALLQGLTSIIPESDRAGSTPPPPKISINDSGECIISGIALSVSRFQVLAVDEVRLKAERFTAATDKISMPLRASGELRGVAVRPHMGQPELDFMYTKTLRGHDIRFSYDVDPANGVVDLHELRLTMRGRIPGELTLSARGTLPKVDPATLTPVTLLALAQISNAKLLLDDYGQFLSIGATAIIPLMIGDTNDPKDRYDQIITVLQQTLRKELAGAASAESLTAINDFIGDFPQAQGPLTIEATFAPNVTAGAIAAKGYLGVKAAAGLFAPSGLNVTYRK